MQLSVGILLDLEDAEPSLDAGRKPIFARPREQRHRLDRARWVSRDDARQVEPRGPEMTLFVFVFTRFQKFD